MLKPATKPRNAPMGYIPHSVNAASPGKYQSMISNSGKRSPTIGEFVASVYDAYFPHDPSYHDGTDTDHVPVIPGHDFPPDASHPNESPPLSAAPSGPPVASEHGLRPES